ncbi:hypothetical protein GCM10010404_81940 [Nonomuraea africana]|uniref:Uncharacterized protein n=1 Tax=Nonomuraea africana TaxID=46171 RepID=A0ABR9KX12_9ACTN|nr:hypothetical protein [Nonomuraea africana]MBE1566571.1 hypothetical protein [Nonomuraea africana]
MLFDFRKRRATAASSVAPESLTPPSNEELAGWLAGLGTPDISAPEASSAGRHPYAVASAR